MNKDESTNPTWRMAHIERHIPGNYGICSLVLAPLADAQGTGMWLLIRFRTRDPERSGIEGDHLYFSLAEALAEAKVQFGVRNDEWKALLPDQINWIDKEIRS